MQECLYLSVHLCMNYSLSFGASLTKNFLWNLLGSQQVSSGGRFHKFLNAIMILSFHHYDANLSLCVNTFTSLAISHFN